MATTADDQIRSPQAAPESPTDLSGRSWRGALMRTVKGIKEDNLTDLAASLGRPRRPAPKLSLGQPGRRAGRAAEREHVPEVAAESRAPEG